MKFTAQLDVDVIALESDEALKFIYSRLANIVDCCLTTDLSVDRPIVDAV